MNLKNFDFSLPDERIAKYPLAERDRSKLLLYQGGSISHHSFKEVPQILSSRQLLVFNNTKVIPARLFLKKSTGATIEIFLLQPVHPSRDYQKALQATETCVWKCMIGNRKKWKTGRITLNSGDFVLEAELAGEDQVRFYWNLNRTFAEILNTMGNLPLPPYLQREAEASDYERYQTIYSRYEGAVAAPTAGLHFTGSILESLKSNAVRTTEVTLHVGAGTFLPVKDEDITRHIMHKEEIIISKESIQDLATAKQIIPVGTTAMRTLESLYWYAHKLNIGDEHFYISQEVPVPTLDLDRKSALDQLLTYMEIKKLSHLRGETQILIYPGYRFRMCDGLFTNFHLPKSTLILLIAAFVGENWKKIYQAALENNYRFLSYGDSSLLIP